jgi:hypothetical protein
MKNFFSRRARELTLLPIFLRTVLRAKTTTSPLIVKARYAPDVQVFLQVDKQPQPDWRGGITDLGSPKS